MKLPESFDRIFEVLLLNNLLLISSLFSATFSGGLDRASGVSWYKSLVISLFSRMSAMTLSSSFESELSLNGFTNQSPLLPYLDIAYLYLYYIQIHRTYFLCLEPMQLHLHEECCYRLLHNLNIY